MADTHPLPLTPQASLVRLGVFGGSFDPVHNGHLGLARLCLEHAQLDAVWFVPAACQPHKPSGPVASDADRIEMLRLATADEPRFRVSAVEIDRGGVSYTVDTLRTIAAERPDDELFFLMGADTLRDFHLWHAPDEVLRLATPVVVHRAGEPEPDWESFARFAGDECCSVARRLAIEATPSDVSSREIRALVARGGTSSDVPAAVRDFIIDRRLYLES